MIALLTVLKVFAYGLVLDIFYVLWVLSVHERAKIKAGIFSIFISAPAVLGIVEITSSIWLIIPYLAGIFVGTVVGLTLHERLEKREPDEV